MAVSVIHLVFPVLAFLCYRLRVRLLTPHPKANPFRIPAAELQNVSYDGINMLNAIPRDTTNMGYAVIGGSGFVGRCVLMHLSPPRRQISSGLLSDTSCDCFSYAGNATFAYSTSTLQPTPIRPTLQCLSSARTSEISNLSVTPLLLPSPPLATHPPSYSIQQPSFDFGNVYHTHGIYPTTSTFAVPKTCSLSQPTTSPTAKRWSYLPLRLTWYSHVRI